MIQPRLSSVFTTPVSVALEMAALSATCRVSIPSQIHTTHMTTKPLQVRSYWRSTALVMCARTALAAR